LSRAALCHSVWTERLALSLCSELVEAQCTPALPCLVRAYWCKAPPFPTLAHKQKVDQCALVLCNEWAQAGTLRQWMLAQRRRPAIQWHACLFHIFAALYALQKYCSLTHHDLHLENVLLL